MVQTALGRRSARVFSYPCEQLEPRTLFATIVVNTIVDTPVSAPTISLRSAIATANAAGSPTTINFDPVVFNTAKSIVLTSGALTLSNATHAITINGPTAGVTISGNHASRVLNVSGTASLTGLTIANATTSAIRNSGNLSLNRVTVTNSTSDFGGGIYHASGNLNLTDVTLSNNTATLVGGALHAETGNATLTRVTASGNVGVNGGAGIYNARHSIIKLTNVTLSGNRITTFGDGGGMLNAGNATLSHVTISGNTAMRRGGGYVHTGSSTTTTISNSIIAQNVASTTDILPAPDVAANSITSLGYNLIGARDNSNGWLATDKTGTMASPLNAKLGALSSIGGFTRTMLPLGSSPAINAGSNALIPAGTTTDQRGKARIFNSTVDIGAVEVSGNLPEVKIFGNNIEIMDSDASPSAGDFTDFGTASLSANVTKSFIVRNDGYSTLTLSGLTVPAGFSITDGLASSLAPGASDQITIKLTTTSAGTFQGSLSFANNDSDENPYNFTIRGVVSTTTPEVGVTGMGVNIMDGDGTPTTADGTDFGAHAQNGTGPTRTFVVKNSGGATLTTGGLTVPPGFTITDGLSSSIAPGASDSFTIRMSTTNYGTLGGTVSFVTNDGDENPFNFSVKGIVQQLGEIYGTLFHDFDGNQTRTNDENFLNQWTLFIDTDKDGVLDTGERTAVTSVNGSFFFTGVAPGTHRVAYVKQPGWISINPTTSYRDIAVASNSVANTWYALARPVSISGNVFNDLDSNGIRNGTEGSLSGWKLFADLNGNGVLDTATTDASGNYNFTGLPPKTNMVIRLILNTGYTATTPSKLTLSLYSGMSLQGVSFGARVV